MIRYVNERLDQLREREAGKVNDAEIESKASSTSAACCALEEGMGRADAMACGLCQ